MPFTLVIGADADYISQSETKRLKICLSLVHETEKTNETDTTCNRTDLPIQVHLDVDIDNLLPRVHRELMIIITSHQR